MKIKIKESMDDFLKSFSNGFLKKSVEEFLRISKKAFPEKLLEKFLENPLTGIPMEASTSSRGHSEAIHGRRSSKTLRKKKQVEYPRRFLGGFPNGIHEAVSIGI